MPDEDRADYFAPDGFDGIIFNDSICYRCKHIHHPSRDTCAAFPDGIPNEILFGEVKHTEEYPGDNGIQYELNPKAI